MTSPNAIFWPVCALALLTAIVAVRMYADRVQEMRARRLAPDRLRRARDTAALLENTAAADNFRNLFELPVLFYALSIALAVTGLVTGPQLALAWLYVALRAAHSAIHVTYNKVLHRFIAYMASTACLFAMWILFAIDLARG